MKKEYGGFLTLEINAGEEYYGDSNYNLYRYNCAKAAINAYLMYKKPRKIYVPFYMCTSTCKSIEDIGIEVEYYPIDKDLLPNIDVDYEGVCIYLVNYFGIMDKKIEDYATTVRNATLVIDNCHSFFHQPIVKENVANIYSCKKFFGVPDGAYLITADDGLTQLEAFYSADIAKYLLDGAERGTNYCYNDKKEVDKYLASNYTGMSVLTQKLLKGIDYPAVIQKRRENFQTYQDAFSVMNVVKCEGESIPYIYPLNVGKNIKKELVEEKIYVPTLWGHIAENGDKNSWEYELAENTIFLPLDQRYGMDDITYIINCVKEKLARK